MRLVGLEAFANSFPHHLSGGMAQRVSLARALINVPSVTPASGAVFGDLLEEVVMRVPEPLGALDAFTRMRMQDEVLRLWEARGTTMLFVTHDIDEAIYMSNRIVITTQPARRTQSNPPCSVADPNRRPRLWFSRGAWAGGGASTRRDGERSRVADSRSLMGSSLK